MPPDPLASNVGPNRMKGRLINALVWAVVMSAIGLAFARPDPSPDPTPSHGAGDCAAGGGLPHQGTLLPYELDGDNVRSFSQ